MKLNNFSRMFIVKVVTMCIISLATLPVFAEVCNQFSTYNMKRGLEAIEKMDYDAALDFFEKELSDNAKNGYAYAWKAFVFGKRNEYGKALSAINKALNHLPKKDKIYVSWSYCTRADIYLELGDTVKALSNYNEAINKSPEDTEMYYKRADLYFELGDYEKSDADFRKLIELDEGLELGYMGLGRNLRSQKRYGEAIELFSKVLKLSPSYALGYSYRAECYIRTGCYKDAADDIIKALDINDDNKAYYLIYELMDSTYNITSQLKIQAARKPNVYKWPFFIARVYEHQKNYQEALKWYEKAAQIEGYDVIYRDMSDVYQEMNDWEGALRCCEKAINMSPDNVGYLYDRASILYELGRTDEALAEISRVVEMEPDWNGGYYLRGFIKKNVKDYEGAIEDYSIAITIEPSDAYSYIERGDSYRFIGDTIAAKMDYQKVLELDTVPGANSCAHYAFFELGMKDKAVDFMNRYIANDTTKSSVYYEAACLSSRMGETERALQYLEKSFQLGGKCTWHVLNDIDLSSIRETAKFKELMEKYSMKRLANPQQEVEVAPAEGLTSEVSFTKENGVCRVKCKINDLPLHFIFDTGASDVTISMVEATFMMKNGYITNKDVLGSQYYTDANGDVSEGTVINLKNVTFGEHSLTNVKASVVRNQKAPLLLGQSVLGRLGKIEIDNAQNVIRITSH